ncbi:hypothetical protein [Deinococcus sp. QL22]|uniref:hypothetical protein n=1 Tax=Deinococcus sp. QL22 TaxID=2939437 RepID=UPI002017DACD|nr:hypothetical protein [Deinococcus sp. QL22]UQN10365.1 hypothetical protein M1R55_29885 [Deinococcus sp. QL22]UQN10499.1 hypothetical protein M1R55_29210 [Deinococcus sp. QL22]
MKKNKLILTTRFHENRPVSIGNVGFWSKRLNGEEEMLLQEVNLSGISTKTVDRLHAEIDLVRHLLNSRKQGEGYLDRDWVTQHVGKVSGTRLISYLRTGEGLAPGETLDLPVFEPIELEGRTFTARALSYAEVLAAAEKADELDALTVADDAQSLSEVEVLDGEDSAAMFERVRGKAFELQGRSKIIIRATADLLADNLNARIADDGAAIDGAWLLSHLMNEGLGQVTAYLRDGSTPDDEPEEGETPNAGADAAAST